jgi:hypothetical protein
MSNILTHAGIVLSILLSASYAYRFFYEREAPAAVLSVLWFLIAVVEVLKYRLSLPSSNQQYTIRISMEEKSDETTNSK